MRLLIGFTGFRVSRVSAPPPKKNKEELKPKNYLNPTPFVCTAFLAGLG